MTERSVKIPKNAPKSPFHKEKEYDILSRSTFGENLKTVFTERSIKVPRGARQKVFHTDGLNNAFSESVKAFFRTPNVRGAVNARMLLEQSSQFRVFWRNLQDAVVPPKLPPLKLTSKPIPVRPLWARNRQLDRTQIASIVAHAILLLLIAGPVWWHTAQPKEPVMVVMDISPYLPRLPAGKEIAGGGGGGGEHQPEPATQGKIPRWSMTRITPPLLTPRNLTPKLVAEPTLLGPPELQVSSSDLANFGDPLSGLLSDSAGPGGGGGIGTGSGGGIGSGTGGGLGPGSGGGTGGGAFRPGIGGVGFPTCIYCPAPQYSEDARKAKYQGTVVLQVIITSDGRATDIQIIKGPGLGLEDRAVEAARTWRFKAAIGPNGRPVATITLIEVNFRLL